MTALLTAVLAFGLTGCTGNTTGGTPTTPSDTGAGQTSSTPTSEESSSGLSITEYVSKPCDILKPDQVATFGSVKAGTPGTAVLGPSCKWDGQSPTKNTGYEVTVTTGKDFEAQVAGVKDRPVFEDKKIDGVRVITTDGTDGKTYCLASIQISKTDSVTLQIASAAAERATKKPCPEAERVAQLIITNLKG
ncbi:DUF3558 domain-containing protein [Lentzea sp. NBC_00516]|uniref:DUF3558 family protein n=1 Tax=Lentzea sp. NBC_00516 TaxID=2903582 RepID=UPI002E821106|nr:DUF3558 family protein [Lentzea sp. NBC_00516]WUD21352.1 DUF3558 domain-containing protein [Lentzea sp. NBC_00516]